jgi:uncharacterized protein YggT (Ycf19 family)
MAYVDFILNLAGLLLWVKWRSLPFDPINKRTPATLVGTLRRAAPSHFRRWHLLAAIGLLLLLRGAVYRWIGPALGQVWVGKLDLGVTVLPFRSDWFVRILFFSFLSFGLVLGIYYAWLLLLSILNGKSAATEPVRGLVRMQLGGIDGWPRRVKIILPFATGTLCWWLASWLLAWLNIIPNPGSAGHRIEQSVLVGLGSYLVWKFVAAALLVLHLLNTYVYFGNHPFWHYVNATSQTLLAPLRKIPLRAGRVDFAPVVGIAIVFFAAELAGRGLVLLYARLPL